MAMTVNGASCPVDGAAIPTVRYTIARPMALCRARPISKISLRQCKYRPNKMRPPSHNTAGIPHITRIADIVLDGAYI